MYISMCVCGCVFACLCMYESMYIFMYEYISTCVCVCKKYDNTYHFHASQFQKGDVLLTDVFWP